jgi:hypothetical protein
MTPEWILAIVAIISAIGGLFAFLLKISKSIDTNTIMTKQIFDQQKVQWDRIDLVNGKVEIHENRLIKLETWKDVHAHERAQ